MKFKPVYKPDEILMIADSKGLCLWFHGRGHCFDTKGNLLSPDGIVETSKSEKREFIALAGKQEKFLKKWLKDTARVKALMKKALGKP